MMNNFNDNLYRLNKIAFHNSANMNFVAIDLTKHTYLQGLNGSGKSSILNAVQIGYLPYNSFDNIDKNYSFKSNKKFTKEETYKFYFPDNNSFIIYEFQNPYGKFCQIILKDTQMQLKRVFVEMDYEELFNILWKTDPDNNLGTPKRISPQELLDSLKNKDYVMLNKKIDLQNIMYHKHSLRKEDCRFSVFPARFDDNNMELMNIIIKLSNDASNLSNDSLKSIMSKIMDNECMEKNDKLNFDPQEFIEPLEILEEQRKNITLKKNFLIQKNNIDTNVKMYEDNEYSISFLSFIIQEHLNKQKEIFENEIKSLNLELESKKEMITGLKSKNESNNQEINHLKAKIEAKKMIIDSFQKNIDYVNNKMKDNKLNKNYSSYDEYLSDVRKFCFNKQKELEDASDIEKLTKTFESNKKDLKRLISVKENLILEIDNINQLFMTDLDQNQAKLLYSINSAFSSIKSIDDQKKMNTINEFTKLFDIHGNKVYFDNSIFCSLVEYKKKTIEELKSELSELEERIIEIQEKIQQEKSKLDKYNNDTDSVSKIKNSINELNDIIHKTEKAKEESNLIINEKELLISFQNDLVVLNEKKEEFLNLNKVRHSEKVAIEEKLNSIVNQKQNNDQKLNKFDIIIASNNLLIFKQDNINEASYSDDMIEELKSKCDNKINIFSKIKTDLNQFINNNIIKDSEQLLMKNKSFNEIKETLINDLNLLYSGLDNEIELLERNIRNNITMIIESIKDFEKYIRQYDMVIDRYNTMLDNVKLSSIDKFRLKIQYVPEIKYFINEIKEIEMVSNDSIEVFINNNMLEKIKAFAANFRLLKENNYKIRSFDIIKSIEIEYLDRNTNQYITTSPSTGTNIVINTVILSMIINSLAGSLIISMPINLDETGQIDNRNLIELINFISKQNLTLFSAAPHTMIKKCGFKKLIRLDQYSFVEDEVRINKFKRTIHLNFGEELND